MPENVNVPSEYQLMSKTKSHRRYWTPTIRRMVKDYEEWEEREKVVLKSVYGRLLTEFAKHTPTWRHIIECLAVIDCLLSLKEAADRMALPKCLPQVVEPENCAIFEAKELRHPCASDETFIPNDISLTPKDRVILLTGPNMGGKSTLLRQVSLTVILAQLGCFVPAASCKLSPIDRIFTRLGANDNIMAGKSTFMMELLDTSKILHNATLHSLVILDELGRGTSTYDGMALAHAALLHILRRQRPLTLFATHYRPLAMDFLQEEGVKCQYMNCAIDADGHRVTFLYKLVSGVSPKSYGMNVAAMAGLGSKLIEEADLIASEFEHKMSLSLTSDPAKVEPRRLARKLIDILCPRQ